MISKLTFSRAHYKNFTSKARRRPGDRRRPPWTGPPCPGKIARPAPLPKEEPLYADGLLQPRRLLDGIAHHHRGSGGAVRGAADPVGKGREQERGLSQDQPARQSAGAACRGWRHHHREHGDPDLPRQALSREEPAAQGPGGGSALPLDDGVAVELGASRLHPYPPP